MCRTHLKTRTPNLFCHSTASSGGTTTAYLHSTANAHQNRYFTFGDTVSSYLESQHDVKPALILLVCFQSAYHWSTSSTLCYGLQGPWRNSEAAIKNTYATAILLTTEMPKQRLLKNAGTPEPLDVSSVILESIGTHSVGSGIFEDSHTELLAFFFPFHLFFLSARPSFPFLNFWTPSFTVFASVPSSLFRTWVRAQPRRCA